MSEFIEMLGVEGHLAYLDDVATANLMTTFGTICSLSPPVKDEEKSQQYYAQ